MNAQHPSTPHAESGFAALLGEARHAFERGDTVKPLLTKATRVARDPVQLAQLALLRGELLLREGQRTRALHCWLDAQQQAQLACHFRLMSQSWQLIASWHLLAGQAGTALRLASHALDLARQAASRPLQARCLLTLARAAYQQGDTVTGQIAQQHAIRLQAQDTSSVDPGWHQELAELYWQTGQFDAARDVLEQLLPVLVNQARQAVLLRLGRIALATGDHMAALTLLEEADRSGSVTPDPDRHALKDALVSALAQNGRTADAVALLLQTRAQRQKPRRRTREQTRLAALELKLQLLTSELEVAQLRREAEAERQKLQLLETGAYRDPLTGLPNRSYLNERLPELLAAVSEGLPLSLLLIDCDQLKEHRERFGDETAERILATVANFLADSYSDTAILARHDQQTFILLLQGIPPATALRLAGQIRQRIAGSDWGGIAPGLALTVSIGHAAAHADDTMDILLLRADLAIFLARRQGGNCVADGDETP
ncbi:diguanylate cyclase domain-containing protein [Chitinilyticum piscinae]|nr:diguanylate cyclase [Chitinilyticum piscinae]